MPCSPKRAICEHMLAQAGHYLFEVKDNQATLLATATAHHRPVRPRRRHGPQQPGVECPRQTPGGNMRRLRYQVAASLDGYIASPNGEFDWIVTDPDIDFAALFAQF